MILASGSAIRLQSTFHTAQSKKFGPAFSCIEKCRGNFIRHAGSCTGPRLLSVCYFGTHSYLELLAGFPPKSQHLFIENREAALFEAGSDPQTGIAHQMR